VPERAIQDGFGNPVKPSRRQGNTEDRTDAWRGVKNPAMVFEAVDFGGEEFNDSN